MEKEKMLELTQQTIVGLLDFVTATKDFVIEQAPLYAQELIAWNIWDGVVCGTVCLALFITSIYSIFKGGSTIDEEWGVPCVIIGVVMSFATLIIGMANYRSAIAAAVAPRVVIVEHISRKLNTGR